MAERSVSISLRLKVAEFISGEQKAKGALSDFDRKLAETAGFAKGFRTKLEAAFKRLPKIEIDATSAPAEQKLAELRAKMEALSAKTIGVDLDASEALAEMAAVGAELEALKDNASFEVRAGIGQALGQLHAVADEVRRLAATGDDAGADAGGGFARSFRARVEAGLQQLPKARIDADATPAQAKIAELRARMEALSSKTIGVDVDAGRALSEMRAVQSELQAIARSDASVDVRADAARALAELRVVDAEVSALDGQTANVRVNADVSGALAGIARVAAALASLAALPALTTIGAGALGLGAAFSAAGAGAAGFAAVAIPSLGRVNEALKQQQSAAGGAGGAAKSLAQSQAEAAARALQLAEAQDRVKDALQKVKDAQRDVTRAQRELGNAQLDVSRAIEDAANRHADALRRVADAERQLGDAQRDALRAQQDLNDARKEAARDLEDLGNRLVDTNLDLRGAQLDLVDAQSELNRVMSDPKSTQAQKERAQLNYDRAVQRVEELQLALQRLQAEQKQADQEGVEGSKKVKDAKDALAEANRRVADAQQAVIDAQRDAARVDEENARRIAEAQQKVIDAQERVADAQRKVADAQRDAVRAAQRLKVEQLQAKAAMEQAGGAAGGAATKMAELSKRERELAKDIKGFQDAYKEWQQSLEGDVFPAISGGLDLVQSQLPRISPLVKSAGKAFVDLERDAKKALDAKIFDKLLSDLNAQIPNSIDKLGNSLLNVGTGFAGILDAFLPFTPTIVGGIEHITKAFADWGTKLGESNEFKQFIAWARANAPKVAEILGNVGIAIGHIAEASLGVGSTALDLIVALSEKLANLSPEQIQSIAGGVGAIFAAAKAGSALKLGAFVLLADVIGRMNPDQIQTAAQAIAAIVLAVKGFQAVSAVSDFVGNLKSKLTDVGDAAGTASGKLESIGKAAGIAGAVIAVAGALHEVAREASGANITVDGLSSAFDRLDKTGRITGDLATAFGKDLKGSGLLVEGFGDSLRRTFDPTFLDSARTGVTNLLDGWTGGLVNLDPAIEKLNEVDQALANMVDSGNVAGAQDAFRRLAKEASDAHVPIDVLKARLPEYADALQAAKTRTDTAADAMNGMAGKSDTARQAIEALKSKIDELAGVNTNAITTEINYKEAIDRATQSVKDNGSTLDTNTQKGRDNKGVLVDLAQKARDYRNALIDQGKTTDEVNRIVDKQRDAFIRVAEKMGLSKKAAGDLANALGLIPVDTKANVSTPGATTAKKQADDVTRALNDVPAKKGAKVTLDAAQFWDAYTKIVAALAKLAAQGIKNAMNNADGGIYQAEGGILRYAHGGITHFAGGAENHIAQIAPAGAMRVWAEPETQGEAYIPLAASKRQRSTQILATVADEFGMQLMPKKLALIAAANGGLVAGSSTPVMATGTSSGGLKVSIDNLSTLTASLDATSSSLNEKLSGATGLLSSTLGETGTVTKVIDDIGKSADKVATTTGAGTTSLTKAITTLTAAINKLTAAVSKAGSAAAKSTSKVGDEKPTATKTTSKPKANAKKTQKQTDPNDVTFDRNPPKKPTNQIDGDMGGSSSSIVGEAAYSGSLAGVERAATLIGQFAGQAFGSVMAGSASRSLPLNGTGSGGTQARREANARRSAPQMGNPAYYNGVYSQAAQSGSLTGRLAHEAGAPAKQQTVLHIENYHPPQNASPRVIAEEMSFIGRRG